MILLILTGAPQTGKFQSSKSKPNRNLDCPPELKDPALEAAMHTGTDVPRLGGHQSRPTMRKKERRAVINKCFIIRSSLPTCTEAFSNSLYTGSVSVSHHPGHCLTSTDLDILIIALPVTRFRGKSVDLDHISYSALDCRNALRCGIITYPPTSIFTIIQTIETRKCHDRLHLGHINTQSLKSRLVALAHSPHLFDVDTSRQHGKHTRHDRLKRPNQPPTHQP